MRASEFAQVRALAAVVQHGSFARAAAHLRVSRSALSQTIRALEERLGVRLVNRTTRAVAPSDAGARLVRRLAPVLGELDAAIAEVGALRDQPAGVLRLNAPRLAAGHFLAPLLGPFSRAFPRIVVEVVVEDALTDIVAGGFDAGIRLGERLAKDMIAVRLGPDFEMMAVAAPAYLAHHGTPATPADLQRHRCINFRMPTDGSVYRWEFEKGGRSLELAVDGPLVVNDAEVALRAALDAVGIAYLLDAHVRPEVDAGTLRRLLDDWSPRFPGFFLYYPSRRQQPPALRAFVDFVSRSRRQPRT